MIGFDEVCKQRAVIVADHRSERDANDEVIAIGAVSLVALAVGPGVSSPMWLAVELQQGRNIRVGDDADVPAAPTTPTVGLTSGLALLAMEACDSRSAITCTDLDSDAINEQ